MQQPSARPVADLHRRGEAGGLRGGLYYPSDTGAPRRGIVFNSRTRDAYSHVARRPRKEGLCAAGLPRGPRAGNARPRARAVVGTRFQSGSVDDDRVARAPRPLSSTRHLANVERRRRQDRRCAFGEQPPACSRRSRESDGDGIRAAGPAGVPAAGAPTCADAYSVIPTTDGRRSADVSFERQSGLASGGVGCRRRGRRSFLPDMNLTRGRRSSPGDT